MRELTGTCERCGLRPVVLRVTNYPHCAPMSEGAAVSEVVYIDACIAPIVQALNAAGVPTSESCCGHGKTQGAIFLQDGRTLAIEHPKETP